MNVINNYSKHYNQYYTLLTSRRTRGPWLAVLLEMKNLHGIQICSALRQSRWISRGGLGYQGTARLSGGLRRHHAVDNFMFQMRSAACAHCKRTSKAAVSLSVPRGKCKRRLVRNIKYDKKQGKKSGKRHRKFMHQVNLSKESYRFISVLKK